MKSVDKYIGEILKNVEKLKKRDSKCNIAFRGESKDHGKTKLMPSIFRNSSYVEKVISSDHTAIMEIAEMLESTCGIRKYKARAICEVIIASMDSYRKNFARTTMPIAIEKTTKDGNIKYQFNVAVNSYFSWVEKNYNKIISKTVDGELYLVNNSGNSTKEISVVLGILEALDVLTFKMIGGANSQLYIYINQIQGLKNILNSPFNYKNRLLNAVSERHLISVKMLTFLYEGDFSNDEIWKGI